MVRFVQSPLAMNLRKSGAGFLLLTVLWFVCGTCLAAAFVAVVVAVGIASAGPLLLAALCGYLLSIPICRAILRRRRE